MIICNLIDINFTKAYNLFFKTFKLLNSEKLKIILEKKLGFFILIKFYSKVAEVVDQSSDGPYGTVF